MTTCCDMPYDVPAPVTDAAILADKIGWVERTAHVDMALYGTIRKTGGVDAIPGLAAGGVSAFKLSTYEYDAVRFPRIDHPTMLAAFREIAKTGLPVAIHNEDQELVEDLTAKARAAGASSRSCIAAPVRRWRRPWPTWKSSRWRWRPGRTCTSRIPRCRAASQIAETFRGMGAQTTGEACIQYLCMTEDDIVRLAGLGKCNPPFRTAAEVERMWACLLADKIAYVSTDHAPWPLGAQDAARHLCQWRRADRAAEFRAADVHAAGRAWPVADADGDLLRRAQREAARAVAEEGRDRRRRRTPTCWCWSAAISRSTRRASLIGRRCAGRRITAGKCARGWLRRSCAAD